MPLKTAKQFRLFKAVGNLKGAGPSPAVAEEFLSKTPHVEKSRFAKFSASIRKKKR